MVGRYPIYIGRDTGNPRVFFGQPIPAPANTVPVRVRVRLPPRVSRVTRDVHGWQEPLAHLMQRGGSGCPPTAPASQKTCNCRLLRVQELIRTTTRHCRRRQGWGRDTTREQWLAGVVMEWASQVGGAGKNDDDTKSSSSTPRAVARGGTFR